MSYVYVMSNGEVDVVDHIKQLFDELCLISRLLMAGRDMLILTSL